MAAGSPASIGIRDGAIIPSSREVGYVIRYAIVGLVCVLFDLVVPGRIGLAASATLFLLWSLFLLNQEKKAALLQLNPIVCYQGWQTATLALAPIYLALRYGSDEGVFRAIHPVIRYAELRPRSSCGRLMGPYAGVKQFQPKEGPRMASVVVAPPRVTHLLLAAAIGIAFHWAKEVFTANLGEVRLPNLVFCR